MKSNSPKRKGIKKALRLLLVLALVIVLLPAFIAGALLIPAVQDYAADKVAEQLTEFLGSEVQVGSIYVKPFKTINLNDLLVRDLQSDTLAYVGHLDVNVRSIDPGFSFLHLNEVELEDAYFNLYRPENDTNLNLQFLIDAFSSDDTTSTSGEFLLTCQSLHMIGAHFRYDDFDEPYQNEGMDFSHLNFRSLNADFYKVRVDGDRISTLINSFEVKEDCGIEIRDLTTDAIVCSDSISAQKLVLNLNGTCIDADAKLLYDGWSKMSDFLEEVDFYVDFRESSIAINDIAFFAPVLKNTLSNATIEGHVEGPISDLDADLKSLEFLAHASLAGSIKLVGLPDPDALFIQANLERLNVPLRELNGIRIPTGETPEELNLPEQLMAAEYVWFNGKYTGFFKDFVAYGHIQTALGDADVDVNLKTQSGSVSYQGKVASNSFDFGPIAESKDIGVAAFDLTVNGKEFDFNKMSLDAEGRVSKLQLLGYNYSNIELDGFLDQRVFDGDLHIKDSNLIFDFDGEVDMRQDLIQITCKSDIQRANLYALNLVKGDSLAAVDGTIDLAFVGAEKRKMHGSLSLRDFNYVSVNRALHIDTLTMIDSLIQEGHFIALNSDYVDLEINGATTLFDLPSAFMQIGHAYFPNYVALESDEMDTIQNFDFNVQIRQKKELEQFISKSLDLKDDVKISGKVDTRSNYIMLRSEAFSLTYGESKADQIMLLAYPQKDSLMVAVKSENIQLTEDSYLNNSRFKFLIHNDSVDAAFGWQNEIGRGDKGMVRVAMSLHQRDTLEAILRNLDITSGQVNWVSQKQARFFLDSNMLQVDNLVITSEDGKIRCSGKLTRNQNDKLQLLLENFDLNYLSNFGITKEKIEGILNADVKLSRDGESIIADAEVDAEGLFYSDVEIGDINGMTKYSDASKSVYVNATLDYKEQKNIGFNGYYFPLKEKNQLDLRCTMRSFRVVILEPFISDFISNLDGIVDGSVQIGGMLNEPKLNGRLSLKDFQSKVNYLNTTYRIEDGNIRIEEDFFGVDALKLLDEKGSSAEATATVFHENFSKFNYDIYVDAQNFMGLNTTVAQNELYYGVANITGDITISGDGAETFIEVVASTNENTSINIPLDQPGTASDLDYIHFVGSDIDKRLEELKEEAKKQISGLNLNFQLAVNDKAEVRIIFDEKIGDIIKVRGAGDMLLEIDTRGKFGMYGDYVINAGDYLFTLQNIVNKRFQVEQGSRISWNGSPYDAIVDLSAIYNLKTSPYNLVAAIDSSAYYKQRMPVDVYLNLDGPLMDPALTFDVELPNLPESDLANQMLDPNTISDQEMNQQVFSLLLANSFAPSQGGLATEGGMQTTGFEMLSNQFSNWASQLSDNFDIGVRYRQGEEQVSSDQLEVSVSKELFDDRVLVEVNGTTPLGSEANNNVNDQVAGEFNIEYKISETENGTFRARAFNKPNNYNAVNLNQSLYTQGVGIYYRKEFDSFRFFKTPADSKKKEEDKKTEETEKQEEEPESKPDEARKEE